MPAMAIEKLIRLIKSEPDESFVIFTYNDRIGNKCASALVKALTRTGIDYAGYDAETGRRWINVANWGHETGVNDFSLSL